MPVTRAAERKSSMNKEKPTQVFIPDEVKVADTPQSPAVDSVYNESSLDSADSSFQSMKYKDNSQKIISLTSSDSSIQDKKAGEGEDESSVTSTAGLQSDNVLKNHELLGSSPLVSNSLSSTIIKTSQSNLGLDQNRWLPVQRNVFLNEMQASFLEKVYQMTPYLDSELKRKLSVKMNVHPEKVKMWFQNRRTKDRQFYRKQGTEPHWLTKSNRTKIVQSSMKTFISDMQFDFVSQKYSPSPEAFPFNGDTHRFPFPVNSLANQEQLNVKMEHFNSSAPPPPSTQQFAKSQNPLSNIVLLNNLQDLTNIISDQHPSCISQVFRNGELSNILPNTLSNSSTQSAKLSEFLQNEKQSEKLQQILAEPISADDRNIQSECGTPFTCNSQLSDPESRAASKENVNDNPFGTATNTACFQSIPYVQSPQKVTPQYHPYQQPYNYPTHPSYTYPGNQSSYGGYYCYSGHSMSSMMPAYLHSSPNIPMVAYPNYYPPQYKSYPYQSPHPYYHQPNYYPPTYRYNSIDMQSALPRIESFLSPQYEPSNQMQESDYLGDRAQSFVQTEKSSTNWNDSTSYIPNSTVLEEAGDSDFNIDQIIGPLNSESSFSTESKFSENLSVNNAAVLPEANSSSAPPSI